MASQTLAKAAVRLRPCLWGRMPRVSNILPQSHPQQGRRLSPAADWPRFFLSAQARLPGQVSFTSCCQAALFCLHRLAVRAEAAKRSEWAVRPERQAWERTAG